MQILLSTNNPGKVERFTKLLGALGADVVTPAPLGIASINVEEGDDILENAKRKALAYRALTDLPILGNDSAFIIAGTNHEPARVKRVALNGRSEHELSKAEIANAMVAFYTDLVHKFGAPLPATWRDALVLAMPDGEIRSAFADRHVTLTGEIREPVNENYPLQSLYTHDVTGTYAVDQSEEDRLLTLKPISDALKTLL